LQIVQSAFLPRLYELFDVRLRDRYGICARYIKRRDGSLRNFPPVIEASMQHISPASLNTLSSRVEYLRNFIGFTSDDAAVLHAAKPVVAPLVPVVVDTVYEKLLSFDITAKAFVPRQTGYEGDAPTKLEDLSPDHPQIRFRKDFLAQYLVKLVTMDYENEKSWEYLDKVGIMHTGVAGFAHR
jgi:hypothetical protein